jgi:uroporphyrinogen-III synthase
MTAGDTPRLGVLVTRPGERCDSLCALIQSQGYQAHPWPAIDIRPVVPSTAGLERLSRARPEDLIIFVSKSAVAFGLSFVLESARTRLAAIGPSTTRALSDSGLDVDIRPSGFDSESLLAEPALEQVSGKNVYIVRGVGGREKLGRELQRRGAEVTYIEVYRRETRRPGSEERDALMEVWENGGIGLYTATSVEILESLYDQLGPRFAGLLAQTPLVTASRRVVQRSVQLHHRAERILSPGPDDQSLVEAIATWQGKALVKAGRQEQ